MMDINWDNLGCKIIPTDKMFVARTNELLEWENGRFVEFGPIEISPGAQVLNYGQGIFEGLKAQRTVNNKIVLFRPSDNAQRFSSSAINMSMPVYPNDKFVHFIKALVKENERFVPPYAKGSLYIRPCMWGTGEILDVTPAKSYTFLIYTTPVGSYLSDGKNPTSLKVCLGYDRATKKGMGSTKCIGNYPGAMRHAQAARNEGHKGCLFLDSQENKFIEEAEAANFFCVKNSTLITPSLGTIMPGITRDSVLKIADELLKLPIEERLLSIEEVLAADECFCSGTLAGITPIDKISYEKITKHYTSSSQGSITGQIKEALRKIQLLEMENDFSWVEGI